MTALEQKLKNHIAAHGNMRIDTFMEMAITHYYATRDPFGVKGDFTTSPEISQMFGEMLGVWCADVWRQLGEPKKILLVEGGPGRGTLMYDMLRATKGAPGFLAAARVVLMETSPFLKERQKEKLKDVQVEWIETLDDPIIRLSSEPVIFVANELLDALPIRQVIFTGGAWKERVVNDNLEFDTAEWIDPLPLPDADEGAVFEYSPARQQFVAQVSDLIQARRGVGLFIDYGHAQAALGDTLQAVKDHQYVPVLSSVGDADLTSHVDFGAFGFPVVSQSRLLHSIGIDVRAQKLNDYIALERLTGKDQMGELFKAMLILHEDRIKPAGFDQWDT